MHALSWHGLEEPLSGHRTYIYSKHDGFDQVVFEFLDWFAEGESQEIRLFVSYCIVLDELNLLNSYSQPKKNFHLKKEFQTKLYVHVYCRDSKACML